MTTAHRPTFDPAKGKDNKAPTLSVSAHALPAHTKLKYRAAEHVGEKAALREELMRAEDEHYGQTHRQRNMGMLLDDQDDAGGAAFSFTGRSAGDMDAEQRKRLMEKARQLDAEDDSGDSGDDDDDNDADSAGRSNSDSDDSDSEDDDGDDAEELLRELERIKRERAEEKARQAADVAEETEQQHREQVMTGNPLLAGTTQDFTVKRRWDDDVVFKNQAKGVDDKPKRRFVNDLIRSDFHRKFMDKYIR